MKPTIFFAITYLQIDPAMESLSSSAQDWLPGLLLSGVSSPAATGEVRAGLSSRARPRRRNQTLSHSRGPHSRLGSCERPRDGDQTFSTCPKSSSTPVARPKIVTETL